MTVARRARLVAGLVLGAAAATGCHGSAQPPVARRPAAPESPPVITVTMREYRFEFESPGPALPAGRVVFRMVNLGSERHNPALIPLDEDVPPIDEQVRGTERRIVTPLASVNDRVPGATGTFAVDLVPGRRYAFICFATTKDGVAHSQKGMTWEGRVPAADPGPQPRP